MGKVEEHIGSYRHESDVEVKGGSYQATYWLDGGN